MKTFSTKLDKISENIIYLLSINSRQPVSKIAKILGIKRKIVETRIEKLFREDYVKYLTISNEKKRIRFSILVKLNKIDNKLIDNLNKVKDLIKLKETLGSYDLSLLFNVYSREEMETAIAKVSRILHNYIISFDVLTHYYEDTLGYKSFCHDYKLLQYYKPMEPVLVELSKDQELILNILMNHTNISYLELSRKTKFNYLKLKRIIKYLVFNGLIRFSIDPDYRKLGLEFHNMFIKIKISEKNIFEDYMKSNPRVHWIKFCQGKWDYIISITAKDINEFIDITKNIRTENKKIIIEETSLISKVKTPRKI